MDSKRIPSENGLIKLLGKFRPQPSPRFYQEMEKQPWMTTRKSSLGLSGWGISWRVAAAALALALVVLLSPVKQFLFGTPHTPTATLTATPTATDVTDDHQTPSPTPEPILLGQLLVPESTATIVGRW